MNIEPYTGNVAGMSNSPWLASTDLIGLPSPELVIEAVFRNTDVKMDQGRVEAELYSVAFRGAAKQMILNATNRKALAQAFGASTKGWIGQKVHVTVQDGIKFGGKVVTGLRLRPITNTEAFQMPAPAQKQAKKAAAQAKQPETPLELSDAPETSLERLKRKVSEEGIDIDRLNAWLDRESLPTYDTLLENEAEAVLALWTNVLKEVTQ
jgi:hypothetical protein